MPLRHALVRYGAIVPSYPGNSEDDQRNRHLGGGGRAVKTYELGRFRGFVAGRQHGGVAGADDDDIADPRQVRRIDRPEHAGGHRLLAAVDPRPAVERLANAPIREVVLTNTLPIPGEKQFDNLTVLSIAPIVAKALDAVFADTSVSNIFRGDNV